MIKKNNKKQQTIIALDGMGGDNSPEIIVEGANIYLKNNSHISYKIFGDEVKLNAVLDNFPNLKKKTEIIHTDRTIAPNEKPSKALRNGRDSSMGLAFQAVKDGTANCAVSAGNTGALMALALFILRTVPGIHRPAICTAIPNHKGWSAVLDLGANLECNAQNLVQFAVMGSLFYNIYKNDTKPTVGLLNIGTEDMKGRDEIREAGEILTASNIVNYSGFIEGNNIGNGTTDVVVADGFTGNIALKTIEGTVNFIVETTKKTFKNSILGLLSGIIAYPLLRKLKKRLNPDLYNGAILLGLDGIAVKSHGGTSALGFASAIGVADDLYQFEFINKLKIELEQVNLSDMG